MHTQGRPLGPLLYHAGHRSFCGTHLPTLFILGGRTFHSRSLPPTQQVCAALQKSSAGSATQRKTTYFRDHATPYDCLPLSHSPTPRPPVKRIARPPTLQLPSRFDSRATHARTLLPAALASVPFGFVLVRVRVRHSLLVGSPSTCLC
jgi:hypothetical protein